jgi:ATP adenylyltransferase
LKSSRSLKKKLRSPRVDVSKRLKAKGKRANWSEALIKTVWPQERDFFERPERYRYVRKLLPPTHTCVFCEAASLELGAESLVLAKDDLAMVVMNKYPYNTGHLLVLPVEHLGCFWSLPEPVAQAMDRWLRISMKILNDEMKCQGFNMGMNHGAVAGAGIPDHLHWHIVPRWGGDTNFFPLIAETKVIPESLEQTYNRLRPHFAKLDLAKSNRSRG